MGVSWIQRHLSWVFDTESNRPSVHLSLKKVRDLGCNNPAWYAFHSFLFTSHVVTVVEYWTPSSQKWQIAKINNLRQFIHINLVPTVLKLCLCHSLLPLWPFPPQKKQVFGLSFSICAQEASKSSKIKPIWPKPCGWALPWLVDRIVRSKPCVDLNYCEEQHHQQQQEQQSTIINNRSNKAMTTFIYRKLSL